MIRIRYISDIINVHRPIFITAGLITHTHIYQWYTRERERERERGRGGWMDGQTANSHRYTNDIYFYFENSFK